MTDKIFTDEEIIKGLECCKDCCCKQCDEEPDFQEAINLINRQKTEIERLNKKVEELSEVLSDTIRIRYTEVKSEAYKEFAERLKSYLLLNKKGEMSVIAFENIDNLLKEMAGEEEMTEILFRGKGNKKYNDGDWYYGVPIQCSDGDWQICTDCSRRTVITETIGQYTGLTDKNGTKIFEGDIIKAGNGHIGWAEFFRGAFVKRCLCHPNSYNPIWGDNETVIGNIHDIHVNVEIDR